MFPYNALSERRIEKLTNYNSDSQTEDVLKNLQEAVKIVNRDFKGHPLDNADASLMRIEARFRAYEQIVRAYEKLHNIARLKVPDHIDDLLDLDKDGNGTVSIDSLYDAIRAKLTEAIPVDGLEGDLADLENRLRTVQ